MSHLLTRIAAAFVHDKFNKVFIVRDPNVLNTPVQIAPVELTSGTGLNLYGWVFLNPNASAVFVKVYDSVAAPTPGVTIPVLTLQIPGNGQVVFFGSDPIPFTNDMYVSVTTGYADTDATAAGLGCILNLYVR
jgi:hypothetical protein